MSLLLLMGQSTPNPRTLFASNEPGLVLDIEEAYRRGWIYQDANGITASSSAGDVVGLVLDSSKGGLDALGSDLVSNGTFASDTVWSKGANWTIGSGVATKTGGAANNLTQTISSTAGQWYRVTMDVTRSAGTLTVSLGTSGTTYAISASGSYSFFILAGSSTQTLTLAGDSSFAGTVDNVTARLVPGNHAYQTTSGSRPSLSIATASSGRTIYGLTFDGSDDGLQTSAIDFTGTDSVTAFAGFRKLSDAVRAVVYELSVAAGANNGAFALEAPFDATNRYLIVSRGTSNSSVAANTAAYAAPQTAVITLAADISSDFLSARFNGVELGPSATDQGIVNYGNYPIYIGRRGGTANPFTGILYTLIIRGATTPTGTIADFERNLLARRCGVTF